jgi:hypothetical protein
VLATNGVLVDETVVDRLVCNVGRGDAIVKDVRVIIGLPTREVEVSICVLTMVVTWVDTWVEVCAVVTTVVWVCMLVWVVCTEVTAVDVVTLLDDGAPGSAGGGGGAGGATVDGGFSGGTTVSCAGMAGLRTIEFDGAVVVGKGSAAKGGAGGAEGSAAFPLALLPLPLPSYTNVIPPACPEWKFKSRSLTSFTISSLAFSLPAHQWRLYSILHGRLRCLCQFSPSNIWPEASLVKATASS